MEGRTDSRNSSSLASPLCAPSITGDNSASNNSASQQGKRCRGRMVCCDGGTRDMASLLELVVKAGEKSIDVGLVHDWTVADGVAQEFTFDHAHQAELGAQAMTRGKTD